MLIWIWISYWWNILIQVYVCIDSLCLMKSPWLALMLSLLLLLFLSLFFQWSDGSKNSLDMVADVLFYKCWTYVKWSLLYQAFGVWLFQLWYSNMCAKYTLFISLNLICCISSVKLLCFLLFLITLLFRLELLLPGMEKNVFFL